MANDRGPRYTQLLVYWLVLTVVEVRLGRDYGQCIYDAQVHPSACRVSLGTAGELRFPLLIFLGGQKKSKYLVRAMALKAHRRRGAQRVHHPPPIRPGHQSAQQAPSSFAPGALLAHTLTAREICMVVKGAGAYLALIYLQTIEKNPGPPDVTLEGIASLLQKVASDLAVVKTNTDTLKTDLQDLKQSVEQRFAENTKCLQDLKSENCDMQRRLNQLERHVRRNNVIIFGVPADVSIENALGKICQENLELQQVPAYESAFRFGKQTEKPPILVKFREQSDKEAIMSRVSKLKGSKLSVSDDLTPEDQAARRTIIAAAKVANVKNIPCRVRRTGLLVGNQLLLPAELCNPDWVKDFIQPPSNNSVRSPPQGGGGASKRTFANIVSPASAAAAALEDFRRPRSSTTDSQSEKAGGRPKRGLSKEDNRQKNK